MLHEVLKGSHNILPIQNPMSILNMAMLSVLWTVAHVA